MISNEQDKVKILSDALLIISDIHNPTYYNNLREYCLTQKIKGLSVYSDSKLVSVLCRHVLKTVGNKDWEEAGKLYGWSNYVR